jgi:hypothetical protein
MLKNTWLKLACSNEYVTNCQTLPCITAAGISASHSCIRTDNVPIKEAHHCLEQVDPGAGQNDALHPSAEGREAERDGLSARHNSSMFQGSGFGSMEWQGVPARL